LIAVCTLVLPFEYRLIPVYTVLRIAFYIFERLAIAVFRKS